MIETNIKLRIFMIQNYLLADMTLDKYLFKAFFFKISIFNLNNISIIKKKLNVCFLIFLHTFFLNYFSSISMTTVFLVIIIHKNGNFILIDKYTMFYCNLQMNI